VTDAARIARTLLDRLEQGIAASDLDALTALCTEDVVLFGSARANVGAAATREYLRLVVDSNASVRWLLAPVEVVHADDDRLVVAGVGEVEYEEGEGAERLPFRLTLVLERRGEDWLVSHFHGSVPEA
jgi:ketosteroid isomerase-like protein